MGVPVAAATTHENSEEPQMLMKHLAARHQCITWPPSTLTVCPVMFLACGDAR